MINLFHALPLSLLLLLLLLLLILSDCVTSCLPCAITSLCLFSYPCPFWCSSITCFLYVHMCVCVHVFVFVYVGVGCLYTCGCVWPCSMWQALMQAHDGIAVQELDEEKEPEVQYLGETVKLVQLEKTLDTPLVGSPPSPLCLGLTIAVLQCRSQDHLCSHWGGLHQQII